MQRWLLTVETNCADPSRERDFNQWYDEMHLPDVLETPGFVRAARYEHSAPGQGQGKFLAVYEIETDDIGQTMEAFSKNVDAKAKQGRLTDLLTPVGGGLYRQLTETAARKRG